MPIVSTISGFSLVLREPASGTGKTYKEALLKIGIDPGKLKVQAWLGSNEAIKQAIASGLGVSFISEISVRKELERSELRSIDVEGLAIARHFYLARRAGRELSPAAEAFTELILTTYGTP